MKWSTTGASSGDNIQIMQSRPDQILALRLHWNIGFCEAESAQQYGTHLGKGLPATRRPFPLSARHFCYNTIAATSLQAISTSSTALVSVFAWA